VVDETDIKNIKPLPNLDYKIVCGNSLLGVEKNLFNNHLFARLEKLKPIFFSETNPTRKQEYKKQIDGLISQITNGHTEFDFEVYFSEVFHLPAPKSEATRQAGEKAGPERSRKGGFDVVIANPPYGIVYDKQFKKHLVKSFPSFKRNNDIYIAFYALGLRLLRIDGVLIYISPNTFLNGDYFKDFRKLLSSKSLIREIFDYKNLHIFEDPTVFVCTICCQRQNAIKFPYKYVIKVVENSLEDFQMQYVELIGPIANSLKVDNKLYSRLISQNDTSLAEEIFHIKDVGFNYWTKGRGKKRDSGSIGARVFYSGKSRDLKDTPFIKGRDISRFHIKKPTNFLVHDYKHHLDPEDDTFRFSPVFLDIKPKIVYRQTANRIIAAFDTSGYYLDKTVHLIVSKSNSSNINMKYILGLLNSTLFYYLYSDLAQEREGRTFAQVKTTYLKKLPIKIRRDAKEHESFIVIVDRILAITKDDDYLQNPQKQAKVKMLEQEIDRMVYKLYGLTEEEIAIVEGKETS